MLYRRLPYLDPRDFQRHVDAGDGAVISVPEPDPSGGLHGSFREISRGAGVADERREDVEGEAAGLTAAVAAVVVSATHRCSGGGRGGVSAAVCRQDLFVVVACVDGCSVNFPRKG